MGDDNNASLTAVPMFWNTYYWIIKGSRHLQHQTGEKIQSHEFMTYQNGMLDQKQGLTFSLMLYPRGDGEKDNSDCASIYLYIDSGADLPENISVSIRVGKGKSRDSISTIVEDSYTFPAAEFLAADKRAWRWPTPIYLDRYADDEFVLSWEVTHPGFKSSIPTIRPKLEPATGDGQSQKGRTPLAEDILKMYDEQIMTDAEIVIGKEVIKCHKFILAAKSRVFRKLFQNDFNEATSNRIIIYDLTKEACNIMLRVIYGGEAAFPSKDSDCDLNIEVLKNVLNASEKYELNDLKEQTEKAFCQEIRAETVGHILAVSDIYRAANLKHWCLKYVFKHKKLVTEQESWKTALVAHPHLLIECFGIADM